MSTLAPETSPVIPATEKNGSLNNAEPDIPMEDENEPVIEMDVPLIDKLFCLQEDGDINLQKSSDDANGTKTKKEDMKAEDNIDMAIAEAINSVKKQEDDSIGLEPEEDEESSDSDDSLSSSSSDSDSSEMEFPTRNLTKEEREKALIAFDEMGGEDWDGEHKEIGETLRTLHEITDIKIVKPNIVITPEMTLEEIGAIYTIVENVIVVEATMVREHRALDHGSILVWEDRMVLGEVFETFGPITRPLYAVRFNNTSEIDKERAIIGAKVFCVDDYRQFVRFVQIDHLRNEKGSDASNRWDEEVDENELEFSDDEKESTYKRELKLKKKKISRQNPSYSQSYPDEGYNILKRPPYNPLPTSVQSGSPYLASTQTFSPTKMAPQKPLAPAQHYNPQQHSTASAQVQPQVQTNFQSPQSQPETQQPQQTSATNLSPQIAQTTSLANATPEQLISALMQFSNNQMPQLAQISQLPTASPESGSYSNAYIQHQQHQLHQLHQEHQQHQQHQLHQLHQEHQQHQQHQLHQEHQYQQQQATMMNNTAYERGRGRGRGWPHGRGGMPVAEYYQYYQYQDPSNGNDGGYY